MSSPKDFRGQRRVPVLPGQRTKPGAGNIASPSRHNLKQTPRCLQTKLAINPKRTAQPAPLVKSAPIRPVRTVQRAQSRVVQALKIYPNLHPGAVEPVSRDSVFRLNSFAGQYRLHKVNSHSVNVPNLQYNFVRTLEGEMLLHSRYRHPSIAGGKQVLYAGEIYFNNGQLEWWSNGSGHYQPFADDAEQANLPIERFFSYQEIIKGEHTRRKGRRS
jgi:hypothetical protein